MNLSDIRSLFDYTEWANGLAMESAGKLSDEHLRLNVNISHQSIFGTLTQKTEFINVDNELFKLLGAQAAPALVNARLFADAGRKVPGVQAFLAAED